MTRIVLIAGKGGVGKSTIAASTAARAAAMGRRSLVVSVDSAPNLGDVFGQPVGPEIVRLGPLLDAIEVDVNREMYRQWSSVVDFFRTLSANNPAIDSIVAEECAVLPGMEEVFGLLRLEDITTSGAYDLIVVDSPPTGDALKLLRLPDVLDWFFEKLFPIERQLLRGLRPFAGSAGGAIPDEATLDEIASAQTRVRRLASLLREPGRTTVRLVANPDTVGLAETRRALALVSLYGLVVDAIVVNKILPRSNDPFLAGWRADQEQVLSLINEEFDGWTILRSGLRSAEVIGADALASLGAELYGEHDPANRLIDRPPLVLTEESGAPVLSLDLPFLNSVKPELWMAGGDLFLAAGGQRRRIPLPGALQRRRLVGARYVDGRLRIRFSA